MPAETHKDRLIRLRDVLSMTGLGRTSIYMKVKDRTFPQPVPVDGFVRFSEREVREWIEAAKSARSGGVA